MKERKTIETQGLEYNRARVDSLLAMVHETIPLARTALAEDGSFDYVSATISFQNGISVLAALDADLPHALFEVIRFVVPPQPTLFDFEARATFGAAYCDKLSRAGAVELLQKYAAVPASEAGAGLPEQG
jgi:hypothetical protein